MSAAAVRFQQMEIPYDFPKMPWIMAKRIVVGTPSGPGPCGARQKY